MSNPSFWVYEGSRRRPGELATDPTLLPDNASPLHHPPPTRTHPEIHDEVARAAEQLASADPGDFPDLFRRLVTDDLGAADRLHTLLEAAAAWCLDHGARQHGGELVTLANQLSDLGQELHLVGDSLGRELTDRSHRQAAAVSRSSALRPRPPLPAATPAAGPQSTSAATALPRRTR